MQIRIHKTGNLDLNTIAELLWQADRQANFHPENCWLLSETEVEATDYFNNENILNNHRDFFVKWIGQEAVITWLTNNQIKFEIISFDILPEEKEMIEESYTEGEFIPKQIMLN